MSDEHESLRRQLTEAENNLRLIQERKAEFVLSTDIPLHLIKEEQALVERIAHLKAQLGAQASPPGSPAHQHGSATSQGDNLGQQAGTNYGTMNQYNYYGTPPPDPPDPPPDPPLPNPFGKRGRIEDPAEFFGREELLRRIFEELERGSNLALIGEREMGKSSLLAMIAAHGPARLGLPPDAFLAIDMQLVHSEDDFFAALCDELKIAPACRGYRLMRKLHNRRFILCLDEIEKMRREKFSVDARDELRGLANGATTPLTLVIASSQPLDELFPDAEGMTSPLNGICHPLDVLPFSRDEARAFLAASLQGTGVRFSKDEIADLLEQSQRRPSRLQQAAAELYRRYTQQGA